MGQGEKRRVRRAARFDSRELARLSGKLDPIAAAWDERVTPQASDRLPVSRTATLDDPLTTSLLAEVARRTKTVEVSPEQIDQIVEQIDPDTAHDPERGSDKD